MCEVYKEYVHSNNELLRANFSKKTKNKVEFGVFYFFSRIVIP